MGDNFDSNYCNKVEPIDKQTYDFLLHKVNNDNPFSLFYFNFFDPKHKDQFFEMDGVQYKFSQYLEDKIVKSEKSDKIEKQDKVDSSSLSKAKYIGSTLTNTPRIFDSTTSGLHSRNYSQVSGNKLVVP